ncbi:MAG: hypothetical protein L6R38_003291 [Xanthoria sp. 2 TBL-2021]|nr:MAG: hypothetical protein L6R38_003291 [Xanthoria sp. 2 TBL-2021]
MWTANLVVRKKRVHTRRGGNQLKCQTKVLPALSSQSRKQKSSAQGRPYCEVPTMQAVEKMPEDQVRTLVTELLPALSEARMSAAHSKLQHNLLSIETSEAASKAEVEREMTRREVQVLQAITLLLHSAHIQTPKG